MTSSQIVERDEQGRFLSAVPWSTQRKTLEGALRRAVHQSPEKLRRACDAVLDSACDGESWQERMSALTFIADRLDGKAVARIETAAGDTRSYDLAELVSLVLNARKADAVEAHTPPSIEGGAGVGDIPVDQEQVGGG